MGFAGFLVKVSGWTWCLCDEVVVECKAAAVDDFRFFWQSSGKHKRANANTLALLCLTSSCDLEDDNDLADLSVRLHIALCFNNFSEGELFVDQGFEST